MAKDSLAGPTTRKHWKVGYDAALHDVLSKYIVTRDVADILDWVANNTSDEDTRKVAQAFVSTLSEPKLSRAFCQECGASDYFSCICADRRP